MTPANPLPPASALIDQQSQAFEPLALHATATGPQRPEVAFQTGAVSLVSLNLNQQQGIEAQDAQILYYVALSPANLTTLLDNLRGTDAEADLITRANAWLNQDLGLSTLPDLNNDNILNQEDARILYYAYRFGDLLRVSPSLREAILGDLTDEDDSAANPDDVYREILDRTGLFRPSVIDLTSLGEADGFIIQGDAARDGAGVSVSTVGDVNGDGYADVIVGARGGDDGGRNAGEAYVVFGRAGAFGSLDGTNRRVIDLTSLSEADGFIIQGLGGDQVGEGISGAGDVNGDGYADLIVGAHLGDDGGRNAGEAYVVFGKAGFFGSLDGTDRRVIDLTSLSETDGFIIQGDAVGDRAGERVSGAGDVNGDGFADLIVGAQSANDGGTDAGEAYVVFGRAGPFGSLDGTSRRVIDLTRLSETDGFIIQGDAVGDRAGWSVSGAGDVNGDGYADLIVGALYGDDGGENAGEAYVVFGRASGFGSDVTTTVDGEGSFIRRVIDLTGLSEADGFIIQGDEAGAYAGNRVGDTAGFSVSGAGDVNGDGYADLIVGARRGDDGDDVDVNAGEAYVVLGKAGGFGIDVTTTVEREGSFTRRVIDLTSLAAEDGFIIQGDMAGDNAGFSVSTAGDFNGDGFADLIVGALGGDDGGENAGEAYVVFGKAGGFGIDVTTTVEGEGSFTRRVVDLDGLVATDGFIIQGDAPGDYAGYSVSAAGDINGDGYADLIVGAIRGDDGDDSDINAGEAYVLFGGLAAGLSSEATVLLGTGGNDDLNVDGRATVVLAGAGDDVLTVDGFTNTDLLKFDGGTGTDTLRFANPDADTGLSLDLSTLADTRLSSIERIDLSGSGDNRLTLIRLDLLNLSEARTNGRAELRVDGNAGDRVSATDTGWTQQADIITDDGMYRVFDNGNARLLVNMEVALGDNLMAASMASRDELLQSCCGTQTVDIRALLQALPPPDEEQQRRIMEDELAMLGPSPEAKAAMMPDEPTAAPETDLFDLPPLIPDDGM